MRFETGYRRFVVVQRISPLNEGVLGIRVDVEKVIKTLREKLVNSKRDSFRSNRLNG